jgi:hypothetical protein
MKMAEAPTSQRMAGKSKEDFIKPVKKKEAGRPTPVFEEAPAKIPHSEPVLRYQKSMGKTTRAPIEKEVEASSSILAKDQVKQEVKKSELVEFALVLNTGGIGGAHKPGMVMQKALPLESDESSVEKKSIHTDFFEKQIGAGEKGRSADLLDRMKYLIDLAKGQVLKEEYDRQTERLKSLLAEIPAKNYDSFCTDLTGLATFQSPPPGLSDKDLETIQIRIRFLSD